MTTIIYAAPFDRSQLGQLRLDPDEYNKTFRPSLGIIQPKDGSGQLRLPTTTELGSFCDRLAYRQFEQIGKSGIYRHPAIPELCCVVMLRNGATSVVPGNNVILVTDAVFQWTFFQKGQTSAQDRVRVINGGNPQSALPTPSWVPQPDADRFFAGKLGECGENIAVLNLKRGGTRIPVLPPSTYQAG